MGSSPSRVDTKFHILGIHLLYWFRACIVLDQQSGQYGSFFFFFIFPRFNGLVIVVTLILINSRLFGVFMLKFCTFYRLVSSPILHWKKGLLQLRMLQLCNCTTTQTIIVSKKLSVLLPIETLRCQLRLVLTHSTSAYTGREVLRSVSCSLLFICKIKSLR